MNIRNFSGVLTLLATICFVSSCSMDSLGHKSGTATDLPSSDSPLVTLPIGPPEANATIVDYSLSLRQSHVSELDQFQNATRYDINMEYTYDDNRDPNSPLSISPYVLNVYQVVRYTNTKPTILTEVVFRFLANLSSYAQKFRIFAVKVDGNLLKVKPEVVDTILRVPITQGLGTGESVEVEIIYSISLPYSDYSTHGSFGINDRGAYLPTTYFIVLPFDSSGWKTDAPSRIGDNEVSESSLFSISIRVPSALDLVSSGVVASVDETDSATRTWHLIGAPVRDFSIFLLKDYYKKTSEVDGILLKVYAMADSEELRQASLLAEKAIRFFQTSFGEYPYRELTVVETNTSAGGIEYPGLVVLSRICFTYQNPYLEHFLAHELAHQWWYGMVGNDQLREPWVDESLAQYSSYLFVTESHGLAAADAALQEWFVKPFSESGDGPVDRPVSYYNDVTYAGLVYGKGAIFYSVIEKKITKPVFFDFLRTYFDRYKYGVSESSNILTVAEEVSGQDLASEYRTWIVGKSQ